MGKVLSSLLLFAKIGFLDGISACLPDGFPGMMPVSWRRLLLPGSILLYAGRTGLFGNLPLAGTAGQPLSSIR